jgi:hypothetical protein
MNYFREFRIMFIGNMLSVFNLFYFYWKISLYYVEYPELFAYEIKQVK